MTRQRAKELLPVIQAWAEGKDIQFRDKLGITPWKTFKMGDDNPPAFGKKEWEWRIKPTPVERWIIMNRENIAEYICHSLKEAEAVLANIDKETHSIHRFRQVLDE